MRAGAARVLPWGIVKVAGHRDAATLEVNDRLRGSPMLHPLKVEFDVISAPSAESGRPRSGVLGEQSCRAGERRRREPRDPGIEAWQRTWRRAGRRVLPVKEAWPISPISLRSRRRRAEAISARLRTRNMRPISFCSGCTHTHTHTHKALYHKLRLP